MTKTRRKIEVALKAKIALEALRERQPQLSLPSAAQRGYADLGDLGTSCWIVDKVPAAACGQHPALSGRHGWKKTDC